MKRLDIIEGEVMGRISRLYETSNGPYKIEVEDESVIGLYKKPIMKGQRWNRTTESTEEIDPTNQDIAVMEEMYRQLNEYLEGKRRIFDISMKPKGTIFQQKVWKALCEIPYGETRSYKEIAIAVGSPKAYRAVGMANHVNPIIIAIPCHRVTAANGKLGGYGQGIEMKIHLLELEGNEIKNGQITKTT